MVPQCSTVLGGMSPFLIVLVVKDLVAYGRSLEEKHNKNFRFTLTTNGVLINDDVIEFYTVSDEKIPITNNRQTVKEPVFALENSDGEYGYGTFFGSMDNDNIANTHNVDFEVFIKCMTNEN